MTADPWGIDPGYHDTLGHWRPVSDETRGRLRAAMHVEPDAEGPGEAPVEVRRAGEVPRVAGPADVRLEDGSVLRFDGALPHDLPLGYHDVAPLDGRPPVRLIVTPGTCPLPSRRQWGWAVQLYSVRSAGSWGIGDLADLRRLAGWARDSTRADLLLLNPLCATFPFPKQQASPYFAISRRYRNPLYLRVEECPGADAAGIDIEGLAAAGRALNAERRIDRDRIYALKTEALEAIHRRFRGSAAFDAYLREQGEGVFDFACFCALAERFGSGWRRWPEEYRRPDSAAVARFAEENPARVRFHQWLQWALDEQLARAAAGGPGLMADLPIGADPEGADGWEWQDLLALDVAVGAPPDALAAHGQNWGLPPFIPHRLRAAGYRPLVEILRANLRHAAGLRIDHVMGLFRLFWIPAGRQGEDGAYVRYVPEEMLGIVALEAHRAGALVVGEDLGTVEEGTRDRLAEHHALSYRLLWFQDEPPAHYPPLSMAAVTTHDLPTVAGFWTGADAAAQRELGLFPGEDETRRMRERLRSRIGVPDDAPVEDVVVAAHRSLSEASSLIVTATLEDALASEERPNFPGTLTPRNWSLALPASLEQIEEHPLPRRLAEVLRRE